MTSSCHPTPCLMSLSLLLNDVCVQMVKVVKILNAHADSLNWIDRNTGITTCTLYPTTEKGDNVVSNINKPICVSPLAFAHVCTAQCTCYRICGAALFWHTIYPSTSDSVDPSLKSTDFSMGSVRKWYRVVLWPFC